jgi:hypothetical protein
MRCEHPRLMRAVTLGAALLVMSTCDTEAAMVSVCALVAPPGA